MKTQICNCDRFCKQSRDSRVVQRKITAKKHAARSKVKRLIKAEQFDYLPEKVYIGHTD